MLKKQKAFTLLEVIIVIIIVGVLASIALPKFFRMVERTRAVEAISMLSSLRAAIERCYLGSTGGITGWSNCRQIVWAAENPANSPNSHFDYDASWAGSQTSFGWVLHARRNTRDLGISSTCVMGDTAPYGVTSFDWTWGAPVVAGVAMMGNNSGGIKIKGYCAYEGMEW